MAIMQDSGGLVFGENLSLRSLEKKKGGRRGGTEGKLPFSGQQHRKNKMFSASSLKQSEFGFSSVAERKKGDAVQAMAFPTPCPRPAPHFPVSGEHLGPTPVRCFQRGCDSC